MSMNMNRCIGIEFNGEVDKDIQFMSNLALNKIIL